MRVILFGASGMVGQGVLRECILSDEVLEVLTIGRGTTGGHFAKLREIAHKDLSDLAPVEAELSGYDACFYCLGVSAVGVTEAEYKRVTYDFTMSAANTLVRLNPAMTFVFVSAAGSDSTEQKGAMWARVKGRTENAILKLGFKAAYVFRPAVIQPMDGIRSRTRAYRMIYTVMGPVMPLLVKALPRYVTTTRRMGRAMIAAALHGAPKALLENSDINDLAQAS